MSVLESQPGLLEALSHEMTPKFLATRSAPGIPNLVPCTSIMPAGDIKDRLILGNFLLRKSVGNLDADGRIGILVITTDLQGWVLRGEFLGWERTGPYVERLNSTDLLRYNAYTGIRNAGVIQVVEVERAFRISKLRVLGEFLLARLGSRSFRVPSLGEGVVQMPEPVRERFGLMTAVRVLSYLDGQGYPTIVPVLSLQPSGDSRMLCALGLAADALKLLPADTPVAANLLTLDVVSFQIKGRWLGSQTVLGRALGGLAVTEVYAGGPPIPGRQIA